MLILPPLPNDPDAFKSLLIERDDQLQMDNKTLSKKN